MFLNQLKQEYSYKVFFRQARMAKIIVEIETLNILDANESACTFYGLEYEDFIKLNFKDLDIEFKENMNELLKNQADFISRHKALAFGIRDVKIMVEEIINADKEYAVLVIIDFTEKLYGLTSLINHNRELEIVLDNLPFMAWFKNIKGQYTVANKQLEFFCGHSKEEIIGRTDYDIFPKGEAERYIKSDNLLITGKETDYIEEVQVNETWREEFKCPVHDLQGNLIGITGFNRDITNRKQKDLALLNAEKTEKQLLKETIEFKDNFIALITHEFKTPLTIINAAIQTLEMAYNNELGSKTREYLNKIKQNSYRQQKLVENLLDITRLKAGRMKLNLVNIDIADFTKEIVDSVKCFAMRKGVRVNFKTTVGHERVLIDDEKYERILLNLLSNAIKFTPSNKNINVKLSIEGFFIKLEIKDHGIGIAKDKQDLIFGKFEQVNNSLSRQAEGTGIGLYLVKSFTEALGGTISLLSEERFGSVFTVLLPMKKEHTLPCYDIHKERINRTVSVELSDII